MLYRTEPRGLQETPLGQQYRDIFRRGQVLQTVTEGYISCQRRFFLLSYHYRENLRLGDYIQRDGMLQSLAVSAPAEWIAQERESHLNGVSTQSMEKEWNCIRTV